MRTLLCALCHDEREMSVLARFSPVYRTLMVSFEGGECITHLEGLEEKLMSFYEF